MDYNIAFFASGSGSNVENIANFFQEKPDFHLSCIISNRKNAYVHQRAQKLGIPTYTFTREDFVETKPIIELLQEHQIDWIVLAGFLLKIPPALIAAFPNRIINIHPALLPKFGGKGMYGHHVHQAVVDAQESKSGITIHYVNENYDEGNIIFQTACEVTPEDTADSLAEKIHALEYEYFPKVIEQLVLSQ